MYMRFTVRRTRSFLAALTLCTATLRAQTPDAPVGLLVSAGADARIARRASPPPVAAHAGDILFAGDRLLAGKQPVSYLFCPARSFETLEANGEALFQSAEIKIQKGKIASRKEVSVCTLPQTVALSVASRQQVGALVMRGERPELELVSPVGGPLLDTPPKFAWQPMKGADSYEIEVANAARTPLWKTQLAGTESRYPPHAPPLLAPGMYYWRVTARAAGKPLAATETSFQLLATADRVKIRQELAALSDALTQNPSDPALRLAKAAALERANLIAPALDDYRALAAEWKDAAWLAPKITQLEQAIYSAQRSVPVGP